MSMIAGGPLDMITESLKTRRLRLCHIGASRCVSTVVLAPCFSLLLLTGCEEAPVAKQPIARPVKILVLGSKASAKELEFPGKISPAQESQMAFEVPGRMVAFPVDEGQTVKKGSVLARLDPHDFQAKLDAEIARVREAEADYERHRTLYEARNVSLADLQAKRSGFEVRKARARQAQKALQDTVLRAPFGGKIAKKLVKDFQNVQAKEPVLILHDNSSLEIVVNIPERDFARGEPGLSVEERTGRSQPKVVISSIPDRAFPARIKEIATTADPDTRTFEVTLAFQPPSDLSILPGMTAKLIASVPRDAGQSSVFGIPSNALLADDSGKPFVWVVDPSSMKVHRASVVVGDLSGTQVEVQSGVSAGEWIAVSGVQRLREGITVRRLEGPTS